MHKPAQIPETLFFEGELLPMCTMPLEAWLKERRPGARAGQGNARCTRGYVGHWELRSGHLYLMALRPFGGQCALPGAGVEGEAEVSVRALFPGEGGPARADWFSGQLRCPLGRILEYIGCDGVHERDMLVDIDKGRVERIAFRHNDVEPVHVFASNVLYLSGHNRLGANKPATAVLVHGMQGASARDSAAR